MQISPTGSPFAPDRANQGKRHLPSGQAHASTGESPSSSEQGGASSPSSASLHSANEAAFSREEVQPAVNIQTGSDSRLPDGKALENSFTAEALRELNLARDLAKAGVSIRPFQAADLPQVAEIVATSFHHKFGKMADLPEGKLPGLLLDFGFVSPKEALGYMVAEKDGQILGLIQLRSPLSGEEKPPLGPWQRTAKYGILTSARTFLGKLLKEKGLDKDECYIEQLAVKPEARGKGIVAALLEKAKDFASLLPGCRHLTLAVPEPDMRNMVLYENLDFSRQYSDSSLVGLAFLGIPQWHYMQLTVKEEDIPKGHRAGLLATWLRRRKKLWWLGFLGFITLVKFPEMVAFFDGRSSAWVFLHLFWLWYFGYFLPRKN